MTSSVEELSVSLVREFLNRKGLKMTLAKLDEELPRTEESLASQPPALIAISRGAVSDMGLIISLAQWTTVLLSVQGSGNRTNLLLILDTHISNRVVLAKAARIERLMKKNKELPIPYRTMIEVIVSYLMERSSSGQGTTTRSPGKKESGKVCPSDLTLEGHKDISLMQHHGGSTEPSSLSHRQGLKLNHQGNSTHSNFKADKRTPTRESKAGNPLTKSLDAALLSSTGLSTPEEALDRTGDDAMMHAVVTESKRATTDGETQARRRDLSVLQAGARPTRHQKFNPRNFADMGNELDKPLENKPTQGSRSLWSKDPTSDRSEPLGADCFTGLRSSSGGTRKEMAKKSSLKASGDLLFEDLEDLDLGFEATPFPSGTNPFPVVIPQFPAGQPISSQTSRALRELLFGSAKGPSFNAAWKKQNFFFCDLPGLEYGLVQHNGGPCGVLACLQAYILKHLLFSDQKRSPITSPTSEERLSALVGAMSEILWKAGGRRQATVTLQPAAANAMYKPDQITERLVLHHFTDYETLRTFIHAQLPIFQNVASYGCILFLFSVILSKGIKSIREDMDERDGRLIGAHGYCCQELVNLLLTGVAVSNVFDGNLDLNSGGSKVHLLKGIPEQSEIGFLSLFEHYGSCTVGGHYKEPVYPIWVVCSESHFTVLFSTQRTLLHNWLQEKKFDLFYYDGLANQDEVIRLSVDTTTGSEEVTSDNDLIPPMELCIRTKWKTATVNWNGTEPIL